MARQSDESNDSEYDVAPDPPAAKRRKLSCIFRNTFAMRAPVLDQLEDVTFVVGNKETGIEHISGNRTIFAVQSDVFQAQLYGNMLERNRDEIRIEDITPQAFRFLKNLFYVKDEQLTVDIVLDVLYACKKYLLVDLECECYKFIENVGQLNDWWKLILQQEITTDIDMDDALIRKSQALIQNSSDIVKDNEKSSRLTPEWMVKLVQSSSFVVDNESLVWEMCVNYCKYQAASIVHFIEDGDTDDTDNTDRDTDNKSDCSETTIIGKMMNEYFVKHIRFAIMDRNYFFKKIERSGILDDATKYDICKCCLFDLKDNRQNKYNSRYCWYPRKPYCQFFMARYDIRLLSDGDEIMVRTSSESYLNLKVENVDWQSNKRNSFGQNGIKFVSRDKRYYGDFTVDRLCSGWCFANINASNENILVPQFDIVKKFYSVGTKVEMRREPPLDWLSGVIESIPDEYCSGWEMIAVKPSHDQLKQKTVYFHPWNFDCLRPL